MKILGKQMAYTVILMSILKFVSTREGGNSLAVDPKKTFPQPLESLYEILLQSAQWRLRTFF